MPGRRRSRFRRQYRRRFVQPFPLFQPLIFSRTVTPRSQFPNNASTNHTTEFDDEVTITRVEAPDGRSLEHDLHAHKSTTSDEVRITGVGIVEPTSKPMDKVQDNEQIHTEVDIGTKCPYTKRTMVNPVRNKICGHNYEQFEIIHYILTGCNPRCPISGCKNQMRLQVNDLEENKELKTFIQNVNAKRPTSHATITPGSNEKNSSRGLLNKGKSRDLGTGQHTANKLLSQLHNPVDFQELRLWAANFSKSTLRRTTFFHTRHPCIVPSELRSSTNGIVKATGPCATYGYLNSTMINGNSVSTIRMSHSNYDDNEGKVAEGHNEDNDDFDEESEEEDDDDWNNVDINDRDKDEDEESESSFCEYGSEMGEEEPVEHNNFDFTFEERWPSDVIHCECDECEEEDDEDSDDEHGSKM